MGEKIAGIVAAIRRAPDARNNSYTIVSGSAINARCDLSLELGDIVKIKEVEKGEKWNTIKSLEIEGKADDGETSRIISAATDRIDTKANAERATEAHRGRPYSGTMKEMMGSITEAARAFLAGYISGAPIVVRFHNDGDGASGAVSLNRALSGIDGNSGNLVWAMQRGIEYDEGSMQSDNVWLHGFESLVKPIVFITDFGTAPGSERQFSAFGKKADFIMLDHHPVYKGFPVASLRHYINPWLHGGNSDFTAGLLTSIFAEVLHPVKTSDMVLASMISDYSSFADRSDKPGQRDAILLDYLTSIAGRRGSGIDRLTPRYIEGILADKDGADSLFRSASGQLNEMLELGVSSVRSCKCRDGITAFILDFGALPRSESGYPLPGRYSSRLQERLEELNGENTITIVHYSSYITLRLSKKISGRVGILKIIKKLEEESEYVGSGGGHNEAASIKVDPDNSKSVMSLLISELGGSCG